jgi:Neurotransmitter-gated ion-channel ligand binding domain/Neurotransmitter-gated ion-channel transmembrane region
VTALCVNRATRIASALVLSIGVFVGIGGVPANAAQPPADVTADLDREVAPRSGAACPDERAYSLARPDPPATPTVVGVGVYLQDVASLNDVEQTLDIDVYVITRWRDSRLADAARGDGSVECPVPAGRLWMPALEPENLRGRQLFYPDRFLIDERGVVTLGRRSWAKVAYPLDFRDFPLDTHEWTFTIWPVVSRSDEMVFHPITRVTGVADRLSIQGWRVGTPRAAASTTTRNIRAGTYARFDVTLDVTRDWAYYGWKLGLPLTLIVLMAYGVYFIPASAGPQQMALGMTAMLTLIAYMLTLGNTLPRISYLTRADWFFVGSAVLVFVGLMKAVMTLALAQGPKAHLIARADRWGRVLYPFAMLANFALAFLA